MELDVALAFGGGDEVAPVVVAEAAGHRARRAPGAPPRLAGVGTPRARPVSTTKPMSFAASASAKLVGHRGCRSPRPCARGRSWWCRRCAAPRLSAARGCPPSAHSESPSRLAQVAAYASRLFTSFIVLPSPSAPRWNDARPSGSRTCRTRRRLVVAADHEHEHAVLGAERAAGERRFDEVVAGRRQARAELLHHRRAVGREVDEDRARGRGGGPLVGDLAARPRVTAATAW